MISDIINDTRKARSKKQKIEILRNNESWALKDILRGTYCDTIQFNLPGGKPPYKEKTKTKYNVKNKFRRRTHKRYLYQGYG